MTEGIFPTGGITISRENFHFRSELFANTSKTMLLDSPRELRIPGTAKGSQFRERIVGRAPQEGDRFISNRLGLSNTVRDRDHVNGRIEPSTPSMVFLKPSTLSSVSMVHPTAAEGGARFFTIRGVPSGHPTMRRGRPRSSPAFQHPSAELLESPTALPKGTVVGAALNGPPIDEPSAPSTPKGGQNSPHPETPHPRTTRAAMSCALALGWPVRSGSP